MTTQTKTDRIHASRKAYNLISRDVRGFGLADDKGRELGYAVSIARDEWQPDAASSTKVPTSYFAQPFAVYPHALRGGREFGAIPVRSRKRAATLDEAREIAEAMFTRAAAAAKKKVAA